MKIASIIIVIGLLITIGIIFTGKPNPQSSGNNVEVKDGIQYITINAKGGYFPQTTIAESGIPTKLIVKTESTYDCSLALVIRDIGFQKILPQTGETEIDIGIKNTKENLRGICSMGMYSFLINFN